MVACGLWHSFSFRHFYLFWVISPIFFFFVFFPYFICAKSFFNWQHAVCKQSFDVFLVVYCCEPFCMALSFRLNGSLLCVAWPFSLASNESLVRNRLKMQSVVPMNCLVRWPNVARGISAIHIKWELMRYVLCYNAMRTREGNRWFGRTFLSQNLLWSSRIIKCRALTINQISFIYFSLFSSIVPFIHFFSRPNGGVCVCNSQMIDRWSRPISIVLFYTLFPFALRVCVCAVCIYLYIDFYDLYTAMKSIWFICYSVLLVYLRWPFHLWPYKYIYKNEMEFAWKRRKRRRKLSIIFKYNEFDAFTTPFIRPLRRSFIHSFEEYHLKFLIVAFSCRVHIKPHKIYELTNMRLVSVYLSSSLSLSFRCAFHNVYQPNANIQLFVIKVYLIRSTSSIKHINSSKICLSVCLLVWLTDWLPGLPVCPFYL